MRSSTACFVLAWVLGFGSAAWAASALNSDKAGIALFFAAMFLIAIAAGIAAAIREPK